MLGTESILQSALAGTLVEALDVSVIATRWDGEIGYWNRAAQTHYGWSANEVLGRNVVEVLVPEVAASEAVEIMERLRAGASWAGAFPVRRRSGEVLQTFVIDTPLSTSDAEQCAIVGVSAAIDQEVRVRNANDLLLHELRGRLDRRRARSETEGVDYRLYLLDGAGHICRARDERFEDDEAGVDFARRYLLAVSTHYPAIEVWCGARRVARVHRQGPAS